MLGTRVRTIPRISTGVDRGVFSLFNRNTTGIGLGCSVCPLRRGIRGRVLPSTHGTDAATLRVVVAVRGTKQTWVGAEVPPAAKAEVLSVPVNLWYCQTFGKESSGQGTVNWTFQLNASVSFGAYTVKANRKPWSCALRGRPCKASPVYHSWGAVPAL